ncbi:hypothetical protein DMN91_009134 [Ooceraea biroi]|uniref:Uncharacterized protein n=1 Tax=Ooceraea biroi TaxID=2015173 RepID=A0A3L8DE72_OOCBI|nr:hypothetical protein DMN91_009134 [Ooceraea biroi]
MFRYANFASSNRDAMSSLGDATSPMNMFSLDWSLGFLPDRYRGSERNGYADAGGSSFPYHFAAKDLFLDHNFRAYALFVEIYASSARPRIENPRSIKKSSKLQSSYEGGAQTFSATFYRPRIGD